MKITIIVNFILWSIKLKLYTLHCGKMSCCSVSSRLHLLILCIWGCSLAQTTLSIQLYAYGVACWEVTWRAELQTRCCQYTWMPLDRLHWNHTGWCYHPVVIQWQSGAYVYNWNTLEDDRSHKYTGMPLEPYIWWCQQSVVSQWQSSGNCIIGTHWKTTGSTLGNTLATKNYFSGGIPVYTGLYVPGTLDCHSITTELPLAQGKGWSLRVNQPSVFTEYHFKLTGKDEWNFVDIQPRITPSVHDSICLVTHDLR